MIRRGVWVKTGVFVVIALVAVPDPYRAALQHRFPGRVTWIDEGAQTTVSINASIAGRIMYIDGMTQAGAAEFITGYHRLLGTLAMAIHPHPQRALVVGLGGGVTAGAVSGHPGAEVDVPPLTAAEPAGSAAEAAAPHVATEHAEPIEHTTTSSGETFAAADHADDELDDDHDEETEPGIAEAPIEKPEPPRIGSVFKGRVGAVSESGHVAILNRIVEGKSIREQLERKRNEHKRVHGDPLPWRALRDGMTDRGWLDPTNAAANRSP